MPSMGAADAQGLRATCPLRGADRRGRMGGLVGRWPIPGCSGMAQALLKRRWEIGAGRGSGARALMVILGWSGGTGSRISLDLLQIDQTLQRSGAPVRADRRMAAAKPLPRAVGARRGRQWCCCGAGVGWADRLPNRNVPGLIPGFPDASPFAALLINRPLPGPDPQSSG